MDKKKVLVGILFVLFLIEITPTIIVNSQTPPSSSAYVASITVPSNPFILDTATLPAINQLGSNIRFFQYPNLTGQLYAYEQQLPQTTPTVDTVESTSWKVFPYWENGELVINSTGASNIGQYIAWRYSPVSNTINITIHVTSFPSRNGNPGFDIFSPNVGDQSSDGNSGFYVLLIDFYANIIWFHSSTSGFTQLYTSLPQPNPNYPFTFSVILTENSAGNVTVQSVYINGTAYTVNVNTPFPWSQIGYIGIRGDVGNLFYVSYFGVSPTPYGGVEQFVNNVESTDWGKVFPYWQNGELVINSTGTSNIRQYIAWRYSPVSNVINVTIHITSFPVQNNYPGIEILSPNVGDQPGDNYTGFWMLAVTFYAGGGSGTIFYHTPTSSFITPYSSLPQPNPNYPFTFSVILTENSAGNVTVQSVYINGTAYSVNINTPFPWNQIGYVGIRGAGGDLFYVSYFGITQLLDAYSLVTNPTTNTPYTGTVYVAVFPYPISYDVYVSPAPVINSQSPLPMFSPSFTSTTTLYPVISTNANFGVINIWTTSGSVTASSGTVNVIPSIGAWTSVSLSTNTVPNFLVNGTVKSGSVSGNTITLSGLTGTSTVVFPDNFIPSSPSGVIPYNATFNEIKTTASSLTFTVNTQMFESGVPVMGATLGENWYYYGFYSSAGSYNVPLFLTTLAVGNQIYANIPMVESTSWRVYPYWENGELVINSTGASAGGQYIAWRYSPISNTINVTIHITSFPVQSSGTNPGIEILSPNVGDQTGDGSGFYALLIDFYGNTIWFHTPTSGWRQLYTSLPQPNPNYPFTFTIILTENSAGNVTVQSVYINGTAYSVNINTPFPWSQIGYVGIRGDINDIFYVSYFGVNSIPLVSSSGVTSFNFYSPFSLPYTITNTSITVQNTQLVDGENYLTIPGTNGIIGASFSFYNVTYNVPVLAVSSSPISVTYNETTLTFTVISASQSFVISPFGVPEQNYQSLTGGVVILPQSEKVTFYANYQPNLVSSSTVVSSPPPTTTTTTPTTTTTSINPNQVTVVINGSVYLTAPWLVHYSLPSVNSSVIAYLIYNYSINKPELVLSSPTNVNVNVTFTASNGTVLLSESVVSPTTVILPMATGNVTVKTTNSTITIPLTYQRFNVVSLTKAIMDSPFLGAIAVLTLFFVSFFIGFVFRTVPNSMALGSVVYITAVAPFLIAIGFPMSIVLLTVVLAVVALIYSVWALRVANVSNNGV